MARGRIIRRQEDCQTCGAAFIRTGTRDFWCSGCSRQRRLARKRTRNAAARRLAGALAVGALCKCESCGAAFKKDSPHHMYCAPCGSHRQRKLRAKARTGNWGEPQERMRERVRNYRLKYPDKVSDSKRQWSLSENGKRAARAKMARRRLDPAYRLHYRMSAQIRRALKSKNAVSWVNFVEFSVPELVAHIERQFLPGMSWDNMRMWDIDHIVPRAAFNLSGEKDGEFLACWALTNLRPLWKKDNQKKSDNRIFLV